MRRPVSGWISAQVFSCANFYPHLYDDIIRAFEAMRGDPEA